MDAHALGTIVLNFPGAAAGEIGHSKSQSDRAKAARFRRNAARLTSRLAQLSSCRAGRVAR